MVPAAAEVAAWRGAATMALLGEVHGRRGRRDGGDGAEQVVASAEAWLKRRKWTRKGTWTRAMMIREGVSLDGTGRMHAYIQDEGEVLWIVDLCGTMRLRAIRASIRQLFVI
jgi:hypothetical protein